jgi:guanine deaminase
MTLRAPFTALGTFVHTPKRGLLEIIERGLVSVDPSGAISDVIAPGEARYAAVSEQASASNQLVEGGPDSLFLPGMVDLHIHAPQWPQLGQALHLPLDQWLNEYTFPLEARFADPALARAVYPELVQTLLANGTTTGVYFSSIHQKASEILAKTCLDAGQRAFVGRVMMDDPSQCPDYYRDESARAGLDGTQNFIEFVRALKGNESALVQPMVTPRFIPSCSDEALEGLGSMAADHQCRVQTHCSEGDWEHQFVIDRFGHSDTHMLREFGLLRPGSVLAHATFLSGPDMQTIAKEKAGIAHCPLSNTYFANSVFPLRQALDNGLQVGLGTDIAGGPSPSLFENCRSAISSSRMLEDGVDPTLPVDQRGRAESRIDFMEAYWLATAGGAQVLDIPVGRFEPGYRFDALLVDPTGPHSNIHCHTDFNHSAEALFQKVLYHLTRANIRKVWVDGVLVLSQNT